MSRKSKLDPYKDQITEWIRQGKDTRTIASKLGEMNIQISHSSVANWVSKNLKTKIDKALQKNADRLVVDIKKGEELLDELIHEVMGVEEMSIGERNAFRSKLEAVREKLRILGAYAPTTQTAIAVQVNVGDFKKRAWELLNESESSTIAGSGSR